MANADPTSLSQATLPAANRALLLATLAFAACFSVWTLYAVMGIALQQQLALSATQYGILLAAPILSGAILRLPLGILADRVSSRTLWLYQMLAVIPTDLVDAAGLLGDVELPVALVGTSYSANPAWNFAGALRQHLQRDLSNHAEDGQGPIVPMLKYLQSEEFKNSPPQLVIWEFPERYLPMANDLEGFDPAWIATLKSSNKQRLASSHSH